MHPQWEGGPLKYSQHSELTALLEYSPTHHLDPVPFQLPAGNAITLLLPQPHPSAPRSSTQIPAAPVRYSQPAQLWCLHAEGTIGYLGQGVVQHVPGGEAAGKNRVAVQPTHTGCSLLLTLGHMAHHEGFLLVPGLTTALLTVAPR